MKWEKEGRKYREKGREGKEKERESNPVRVISQLFSNHVERNWGFPAGSDS